MFGSSSGRRTSHAAAVGAAFIASVALFALSAAPASAILLRVDGHWVSYEAIPGHATPHTPLSKTSPANQANFDIFNGSAGYLNYSGGPIMPSNTNYVFVWNPSNYTGTTFGSGGQCGVADSSGNYPNACTDYVTGVSTFLQDLAADSGKSTNTESVQTQYNDAVGPGHVAAYDSTYGSLIVDTNPAPANGCPGAPSVAGGRCISDAQVQSELQSYLSSHGYPAGMTNEYFVLTPPDIASCFDTGGSECSANAGPGGTGVFCAYHSTTATAGHYIYSNIPDMDNVVGCDPFVSDSPAGNSPCGFETCIWPNGWADGVLSAVAHEHQESVTDPQPNNAWADWSGKPGVGGEDGDKCNFDAGDDPNAVYDDNPATFFETTPHNQTINGRNYFIQREWSNQNFSCVGSWPGAAAPGASFVVSSGSGTTVNLDASGSGAGIAQYVWQFNDGPGGSQKTTVTTTSPTISHTFPSTGSYTVALTTMMADGLSHGTLRNIGIYGAPRAVFTASSLTPMEKSPVGFNATASTHDPNLTITSYKWSFGDGTTGIGRTVSHAFRTPGTRVVKLTVTDSTGATSSITKTLRVKDRPPTVSFTAPTGGVAGKPVSFVGKATDDEPIRSYLWTFGDGKTASGAQVKHTYARKGTYTVKLKATDASNVSKTVSHPVTIR